MLTMIYVYVYAHPCIYIDHIYIYIHMHTNKEIKTILRKYKDPYMRSKGGQKWKHCDQYYLNKTGLLTADLS